jgi:hypothetical protein
MQSSAGKLVDRGGPGELGSIVEFHRCPNAGVVVRKLGGKHNIIRWVGTEGVPHPS